MSSMLLGIADPFLPFENLCSALFLGGILDSLQQMFYGKPKAEEQEEAKKNGETITTFFRCTYRTYRSIHYK